MRIRLLRHAGVQSAEGRGLPDHPRQFEPGHDHDRSGVRRPDVHRAADAGDAGADHRAREAGRDPADGRRPDRHQPGHGALRERRAGAARRRADRRELRGHQDRRGPAAIQREAWSRSASKCRARATPARVDDAEQFAARHRLSARHPPVVHARRLRRRHRLQRRRAAHHRRPRPRALAGPSRARRRVGDRLERVRARGDARQGGQRHHRLLASRTSIRWACTPATRSPSRRSRR